MIAFDTDSHVPKCNYLCENLCSGVALEFFTNSPQYKNAKIANFVLAVQIKIE